MGNTLAVVVTARNDGGSASATSKATTPLKYFVVVAVGDIACQPEPTSTTLPGPYQTTSTTCQQQATANLAAAQHPDAVLMLGDGQYWNGALAEYNAVYDTTWGVFNPMVYPVPGNHEYGASPTADGYFGFFGNRADPLSNAPEGYYSFNLGTWHFDALNSDCSDGASGPTCVDNVGGETTSKQTTWLQTDLSANSAACTLAFWHHPFISAGDIGNNPFTQPLFNALYNAHSDIVLNGHDHLYERYPQLDSSGTANTAGVREFVVGTGGEDLVGYYPTHVSPTAPTVNASEFGVLVLTLHTNSYDWKYLNTNSTVVDSSTAAVPCHGRGGAAPLAAQMASGFNSRLFLPALTFAARPMRSSLDAVAQRGLPVAIHLSRASDISIVVSLRRGHRVERIAQFYETESQVSKPYDLINLRLPRQRLQGLRHATLVLRFAAVDAAGHHRVLTRTVSLNRR